MLRWLNTRYEEEASGGEGDSGGGEGSSTAGLSQDQVNTILAKERRAWQTRLDTEKAARETLETQYGSLKGEFGEFKKILEEAAAEVEAEEQQNSRRTPNAEESLGDPLLDEFNGILQVPAGVKDKETYIRVKKQQFLQDRRLSELTELVKTQHETLQELRQRASAEQEARERAEAAQRNAMRDAEINDALVKNRCIDPSNATLLFRDRVQWDDRSGSFKYHAKDGSIMPISEGISNDLPPYLVQSAANQGGSGASGGRSVTDQHLSSLEQKVNEAAVTAKARPQDSRAMMAYQQAKRAYQEAQAQRKGAA